MNDLISRSALIEEFKKCHISFNSTPMEESDMMISYRSLARVINRQPTVEANLWFMGNGYKKEMLFIIGDKTVLFVEIQYMTKSNHTTSVQTVDVDMRGRKND